MLTSLSLAFGVLFTVGAGWAPAAPPLTCAGKPVTIQSTEGDDEILLTDGNDVVNAQGGNDTIRPDFTREPRPHTFHGGNDIVCGDEGNDTIVGGKGDDKLYGGSGDDRIDGVGGRDRLVGFTGNDDLEGGDGADQVDGGPGDQDKCHGNLRSHQQGPPTPDDRGDRLAHCEKRDELPPTR